MNELILALAAVDPPNEPAFQRALGVPLEFADERRYFIVYKAKLPDGPFEDVEIRINKEDPTGVVILQPRAGQELTQKDLDPTPFGEVHDVKIEPRVPPEGEITHVFRVGKPFLNVAFTADSGKLTWVSLDWELEEAPQ